MKPDKDLSVNIVAIARFPFRYDECFKPRYCPLCGTRLGWYCAGNDCYVIECKECKVRFVTVANSPDDAMDNAGVIG